MASTGRPRNDERRRERQQAFLAAFSKTGLVKNASEESGVAAAQHYRWLDEDEDYAAAFNVQRMRTAHLAQKVRRSPGPSRGFKHTGSRAERRKTNQDKFLEALAQSGIVQDASEQTGVPMGTHYFWLRTDTIYAERAKWALEAAAETRKQLISERISKSSNWSPERREAWSAHQRDSWTPEMRAAAAQRNVDRMADPEYAERWLAASRKSREFAACDRPDYFDEIDTPEKAYWLGFIVTDGMVTGFKSGCLRMQIKLARKDRGHLEILHRTLEAKRPVRDREEWSKPPGTQERKKRPVSILQVCSPRLVNALVSHGVKPRKTDIVEPWGGPADLMPHYWRGIMDGDGTLGTYDGEVKVGLCGSRPLVEAFIQWAHGVSGTTANPRQGTQGNRRYCTVYMGGNIRAPKLLAALYDDAPVALARKKAEADLIVHGKPFSPTLS